MLKAKHQEIKALKTMSNQIKDKDDMSMEQKVDKIFDMIKEMSDKQGSANIEIAKLVIHQEQSKNEIKDLTIRMAAQEVWKNRSNGALYVLGGLSGALIGYILHKLGFDK